jgi:outer membrane receptor protein involved in Fe transport
MDDIRRCTAALFLAMFVGLPSNEVSAQAPEPSAETAPDASVAPGEPTTEETKIGDPAAQDEAAAGEPLAAPSAEASVSEPLEAETSAKSEDVMVVTGTRIKRNSFDTPTPVQVVTREQITRTGASNMADLIRILTANSGSETQFGLGNGSTGSSQFNLRGLGLANTLVLLNGRRLVSFPDAFGVTNSASFADVNQIPLQFIERIEVAKGGASAIYGSDAIAGVVNIILRDDFEGAAFTVNGLTTDRWDQQDGEVAAIFGARSDKSSVVAQFSYFRRAPLAAKDRDFTKGTLTSTVGNPGTFLLPDVSGQGGPTMTRVDEGCGAPGSTSYLDPGNPATPADDRCRFDFRNDWNLFNKEERILGYVTAEHEVAEIFRPFLEFGFARKETIVPQSPSYPLLRSVLIPADHVDNPYGQSAIFLGRPFGRAAGSATQNINVNGYRAVGGVRGDLDAAHMPDWNYELSVTWHMNEFSRRNADILFDRFQEAVNSCSDPNDLTRCFNPWYTAISGEGTVNSAEVVDYIDGQYKNLNTTKMLVGDLSVSGPLYRLPGGNLALAVGAQLRRNEQFVDNDNDFEDVAYAFNLGGRDWRGTQNVAAGFGELSVPFYRGVEVQAALRAEHYQQIDTAVTPRGGASWALGKTFPQLPSWIAGLRVRGSVGTAFRAPNLLQTNGSVTNLEQFVDPTPAFRGVTTVPNPNLKPEKSLAFSAGFEWLYQGFNVDLDYWQYKVTDLIIRQNAQAYLAECRGAMSAMGTPLAGTPGCENFTLTSGSDNWESVEVTYANQDKITTNGIDFVLGYKLEMGARAGDLNVGVGGTFTHSYMVPATAVPELTVSNPNTDPGEPATIRVAQDGCDGATKGECNLVGKRNQNNFALPLQKVRMRVPLSWALGPHAASFAINYISGYDDDATYDPATGKHRAIDGWVTLDLGYGYSLGKSIVGESTQIRVGINNLLGADPPKLSANTNFGYDIYTHDPRRRILYANLTHKF